MQCLFYKLSINIVFLDVHCIFSIYCTQCNGDCSMKKKCKEFCQFRLILPIKIYVIFLILKMFYLEKKSYVQKNPLKTGNDKINNNLKIYANLSMSENG